MAAGDQKVAYGTSDDFSLTNLDGELDASQTHIAGWTSAVVDNSSNLYGDYIITGKLTTESSNLQAGEILGYVYTELDENNWPDLFSAGTEGTEGTATVHDTEQRDSGMRLAFRIQTDAGAGDVFCFDFSILRVFGYSPRRWALWLTGDAATTTADQLAAAGNQITYRGVYSTVAQ